MTYKRLAGAFIFCVLCFCLLAGSALAAEAQAEAVLAVTEAPEEARASVPPAAGAAGLAILLLFGIVTSKRQRQQEERGYDPIQEENRIGDSYSRIAGKEKRRRWFP